MAAHSEGPVMRWEAEQEQLAAYLKTEGLKGTRQRARILEVFLDASKHISVEELLGLVRKVEPGIGHATIYRTMKLLVSAGLAAERRFGGGVTLFEPEADSTEHHDHLICVRCGMIVEFEHPRIEELQEEVAETHGFLLTHHKMELYGVCPSCS